MLVVCKWQYDLWDQFHLSWIIWLQENGLHWTWSHEVWLHEICLHRTSCHSHHCRLSKSLIQLESGSSVDRRRAGSAYYFLTSQTPHLSLCQTETPKTQIDIDSKGCLYYTYRPAYASLVGLVQLFLFLLILPPRWASIEIRTQRLPGGTIW